MGARFIVGLKTIGNWEASSIVPSWSSGKAGTANPSAAKAAGVGATCAGAAIAELVGPGADAGGAVTGRHLPADEASGKVAARKRKHT